MATGFAGTFIALLLCRSLLGFAEAGGVPATGKGFAMYLHPEDRATGAALSQVGLTIGSMGAPLLTEWMSALYGWRSAFIVSGASASSGFHCGCPSRSERPRCRRARRRRGGRVERCSVIAAISRWSSANILAMTIYSLWTNWTTVFLVSSYGLTRQDANLRMHGYRLFSLPSADCWVHGWRTGRYVAALEVMTARDPNFARRRQYSRSPRRWRPWRPSGGGRRGDLPQLLRRNVPQRELLCASSGSVRQCQRGFADFPADRRVRTHAGLSVPCHRRLLGEVRMAACLPCHRCAASGFRLSLQWRFASDGSEAAIWKLLGKDPEAVVVSFLAGPEPLARAMLDEVRSLVPDREHFAVTDLSIEGVTCIRPEELPGPLRTQTDRTRAHALYRRGANIAGLRRAAFRLGAW